MSSFKPPQNVANFARVLGTKRQTVKSRGEATNLFDVAVDGVVVSRVRIERAELHPA